MPWDDHVINTILLTIAVLVAFAAVIIYRKRIARRGNPDLGWMSAQWLAEYRASNP